MRLKLLVINIIACVGAICANATYIDYAQIVSADGEAEIRAELAKVEAGGLDVFMANLGKIQKGVGSDELKNKVNDYGIVLYVGYDTENKRWTYEILASMNSIGLLEPIETEWQGIWGDTNGGNEMNGTIVRNMFVDILKWMQGNLARQATGHMNRQIVNVTQAWPFLPTPNKLANRIAAFGNMLDNKFGKRWKDIREVHTSTNLQVAKDYETYLVGVVEFAKELRDSVKAMSDYIENNPQPTFYGQDLAQPLSGQIVHLHSGGHDWWQDRYFQSARNHFASALSYGTIPQMLTEIAALEYSVAYYYLDWVYELAGKQDLLAMPLVRGKGNDLWGNYTKWDGYNEYTFYGMGTATAGVNIPAIFVRVGAGAKQELQQLKYKNSKIDLEWSLFMTCSSAYTEGAIGVGEDFLKPSAGVSVQANPGTENFNSSNTKAYHYYPPIFFRDPGYDYTGVKGAVNGSMNMGSASVGTAVDMTIAGDIRYRNASRILGLSAYGLNVSTGGGGGVGGGAAKAPGNIQGVLEVGTGRCWGFDLKYTKPLKATLDRNTNIKTIDIKDQKIIARTISYPSADPKLDPTDQKAIAEIVRDIKLFRDAFPERALRVEIKGMSAGLFNHPKEPKNLTAADSAALNGLNAEVYANYSSTKFMLTEIDRQIEKLVKADATIKINSPTTNTKLLDIRNLGAEFYGNTNTYLREMQALFAGRQDDWNLVPAGFRNVVVTLVSHE